MSFRVCLLRRRMRRWTLRTSLISLKVDDETEWDFEELDVAEELGFVNGVNFFDGFELR